MNNTAISNLFKKTRDRSDDLIKNLSAEDMNLQSMEDASPIKWNLAHTTWFFEKFVLSKINPNYEFFNETYNYLFNSYYVKAGPRYARSLRNIISRPGIEEVLEYRKSIDLRIVDLCQSSNSQLDMIEVGCHHEMQHQELMLMDLQHGLSFNPLEPKYDSTIKEIKNEKIRQEWIGHEKDIKSVGTNEESFSFDCERPQHEVLILPFEISNKLVTNGEWIEFIENDGYAKSEYWLSDGFLICEKENWQSPLYWKKEENKWYQFTLNGNKEINTDAPVSNISYYEADAFARWSNKRIPTEFEWEVASNNNIHGNFLEDKIYQPYSKKNGADLNQNWGHVWEWTSSNFAPYPGFKCHNEDISEYNGKFMINQMVLKGGSCFTPKDQMRKSYRNFFYPHQRWQMSGLRLAK